MTAESRLSPPSTSGHGRASGKAGGIQIVEQAKTRSSRRTLGLAANLIESLRAHRASQAQTILEAGPKYDRDADLVFANDLGGPLDSRNVINRYFEPALEAAGLSTAIRLYDLRHSHTALLLHEGVNVKAVSARLGHSSAAMKLDRYAHALSAAVFNSVLGGLPRALSEVGTTVAPRAALRIAEVWRPRQDSNLRPSAPEADALSS